MDPGLRKDEELLCSSSNSGATAVAADVHHQALAWLQYIACLQSIPAEQVSHAHAELGGDA
jgi:hypothetical protein